MDALLACLCTISVDAGIVVMYFGSLGFMYPIGDGCMRWSTTRLHHKYTCLQYLPGLLELTFLTVIVVFITQLVGIVHG